MQKSAVVDWIRRGALVALSTTALAITGCGGGGGGGKVASSTDPGGSGSIIPGPSPDPGAPSVPGDPSQPGDPTNTPPTITAFPLTAINVGAKYTLAPTATDADGDTLAFSIANRPAWASFNTATGELSGTPDAPGMSAGVVITVSDGKTSAELPAFSITVASASSEPVAVAGDAVALSWDVPTRTVDGDPLADLAGYRIHYGTKADALTEVIELPSAGSNTYVVEKLKSGTYYFAVTAVTTTGTRSELSNVISRVIS